MTFAASAPPAVIACLEAWRAGASDKWRQVATNIQAETALPLSALTALLADLAVELARGASPETGWIQVCRQHQYKGPRLPVPLPAVVGRAVPLGTYAKVMSDSLDVGLSPDQAEALLRKVAMAGAAVAPRDARILRRALLGRYVVWATFCSANPDQAPFEFLPRTTDAIRTALGLGECAEAETLVLVSYTTAGALAAIELFRPTVGDAGDYHWFRPHPDPLALFGMTRPLAPNLAGLAPQPEVVHGAVRGDTIVFPLYLAV